MTNIIRQYLVTEAVKIGDRWTDKFICPKCKFSFLKDSMKRCPACKRLVVWANEIDDENGEY